MKKTILKTTKTFIALWAIVLSAGLSPASPLCAMGFAAIWALFSAVEKVTDKRATSAPVRVFAALYALLTLGATWRGFTAQYTSGLFRAGALMIAASGSCVAWMRSFE